MSLECGYGNADPQIYSRRQALELLGRKPDTDPGQFNIPHNICCDPKGWIYVADRENHRVQVFDGNGKWEAQWNYLHPPNGMCLGSDMTRFAKLARAARPQGENNRDWPNIGPRVSIHTLN